MLRYTIVYHIVSWYMIVCLSMIIFIIILMSIMYSIIICIILSVVLAHEPLVQLGDVLLRGAHRSDLKIRTTFGFFVPMMS